MTRILAVLFAIMCAAPIAAQGLPPGLDPQNTIFLDTKYGRVIIKLRNDVAPQHAERLKLLAREHFYDNVPFHRVIDGFRHRPATASTVTAPAARSIRT